MGLLTREDIIAALHAIERTLESRVVVRIIIDAEGRVLRRIYRSSSNTPCAAAMPKRGRKTR